MNLQRGDEIHDAVWDTTQTLCGIQLDDVVDDMKLTRAAVNCAGCLKQAKANELVVAEILGTSGGAR